MNQWFAVAILMLMALGFGFRVYVQKVNYGYTSPGTYFEATVVGVCVPLAVVGMTTVFCLFLNIVACAIGTPESAHFLEWFVGLWTKGQGA